MVRIKSILISKRQPSTLRWLIYIFNSVDETKLSRYIPSTQNRFLHKLPPFVDISQVAWSNFVVEHVPFLSAQLTRFKNTAGSTFSKL